MKNLYKHLEAIVKKRGDNNQYTELVSESNFLKLSIKEKVDFIRLILSGKLEEKDKIKLQALAYQYLTKPILDYNLKHLDSQLDFIYDDVHQHQIDKLLEVLDFLNKHKNFESTNNNDKTSVLKGFTEELRNLFNKIGRAFSEINQGPTHTLHEIDSAFNQAFNRVRRYLKADPTEKILVSFIKQFAGGSFNLSVWLSKQIVNSVRKPIACSINVVKCLANLVSLKPQNAYINFKNALHDLKDTAVAWATSFCAVVFTPFVPLASGVAIIFGVIGVHSAAAVILASSAAVKISAHKPLGIALESGDAVMKTAHVGVESFKGSLVNGDKIEEQLALKTLYHITQNYKDISKSDFENNQIKQQALNNLNNLNEYIQNKKIEDIGIVGGLIYRIKNTFNTSFYIPKKLPKTKSYDR